MIHRELEAFVARLEAIPPGATLDEDRRAWRAFCLEHNRPPPAEISVRNRPLELSDRIIRLRMYAPSVPGPQACVIYLHGGGWVLGDLDTQDTIAWGLAEGAGAVVISVDYRLAPGGDRQMGPKLRALRHKKSPASPGFLDRSAVAD